PDRDGAIVVEVLPGTPAALAGLKTGDVIISINGEKLKNSNDFMLKVGELPPGVSVQIAVIQDGALKNMNLTLADREVVVTAAEQWRGIHVADIGSSPAMQFDIGNIDTGVVVVKVTENSPAADTSLGEGDVIVEINNEPVDNVSEFLGLRDKYSESKKPILIYRLRKQPNGRIEKGFVAVKS
ncbi:MAG: PDZ domain-containing protein, partial [Candidatus Latescibacteria bacterium]|nr:PDZ domain-containing protein [Candidatus Latescibacterota bacterium]